MTRKMILDKLLYLINEQDPSKTDLINENSSLKDDLGVDSIELTEFIINIEDEFKLSIPDEAVEQMETISDIMTYLEKHSHTRTK
ncbi:phosphopantetheine-binding protein [Streptococcus catagoni]|uniref:phosphopantetheine-binding protein n=1 Tax=Streptococcus catagoni TaxID=2654874 RepID=UPI0014077658|nr:phosphopantetheine-binding protein [Streptococcus catagoni]